MLAYDAAALLVEIGSCLGLWLGLSVVGVYDQIAVAVFRVGSEMICFIYKLALKVRI